MTEHRTTAQRRTDTLALFDRHGSAWLATAESATADDDGARLILVTAPWTGDAFLVATRATTPTARNLAGTGRARLGFGHGMDAVLVDARVTDTHPATAAPTPLRQAFSERAGWDPAEEGPDWVLYRVQPVRIEAYRGYGELPRRVIMRDGAWLA